MAWKIEHWLSEVFPGETQIYAEYRALAPRELAIVTASVLDVALTELIALRLADNEKEVQDFLGLISEAGEGLLLSILTLYQAYFHRMHSRVQRVGNALHA